MLLTPRLRAALKDRGVECLHPHDVHYPADLRLEPPCSLKRMQIARSGFSTCVDILFLTY